MKKLLTILALIGTVATRLSAAETTSRPNLIFLLADDFGLGNVSCYGGQFKTPQLDALANTGTRFEYCFSTPLCGPSRAQILTGRYPFHTGMTSNRTGSGLKPTNEILLPKVLKSAGYVTAQVGKWAQLPLQPGDWGFDEYLRFQGSGKYWATQDRSYTLNGQRKTLAQNEYLPDVMHDFLLDFITRHKGQPFYVHYALSHIHGRILRTPDSSPGSKDFYADNIAYLDKLVGRLVAELERLKLRDRTLILFAGDNGTAPGFADRATVRGQRLSGQKGTMWEGGSRVPLIVSWPGATPAGKVCRDLTDFSDFFPTFAELAGAKLPEGVTIDGRSFAPQVKGQPGNPREWVYVELAGKRYVRTDRWKLNNSGELFDMKEAPFKELPVARDSTDGEAVAARRQLQQVLERLMGKNGAPANAEAPGKANVKRAGKMRKQVAQ